MPRDFFETGAEDPDAAGIMSGTAHLSLSASEVGI